MSEPLSVVESTMYLKYRATALQMALELVESIPQILKNHRVPSEPIPGDYVATMEEFLGNIGSKVCELACFSFSRCQDEEKRELIQQFASDYAATIAGVIGKSVAGYKVMLTPETGGEAARLLLLTDVDPKELMEKSEKRMRVEINILGLLDQYSDRHERLFIQPIEYNAIPSIDVLTKHDRFIALTTNWELFLAINVGSGSKELLLAYRGEVIQLVERLNVLLKDQPGCASFELSIDWSDDSSGYVKITDKEDA